MSHTNPLERYFSLLEILATTSRGMNQTTLAKLSGLPKPAVHRLLASLLEADLVQHDAETGRIYTIGRRMNQLAMLCISDDFLTSAAQIVLAPLARKFNETSFIVRLEEDSVRSIAMSAPERGYRLHIEPGFVITPHAGASAKAILAFQPETVVRRVVREPLEQLTRRTHRSFEGLMTEFDGIRKQGHAVCDREIDENAAAIACPVQMATGETIFSIAITGPRDRIMSRPVEEYVKTLSEAATKFRELLVSGGNGREPLVEPNTS